MNNTTDIRRKNMKYISSINDFRAIFSKRLYEKIIKESSISCIRDISKKEFNNIIDKTYNELENYEYKVGNVDEKVFVYKNNNVARIIPVLSIKDELVYYFACKMIEDEIAVNRTINTYGGWRLGNKIKLQEDSEIDYVYRSYNPGLWNENWKQFQNIIYNNTQDLDDDSLILKLDIANFYDTVNLNLLEKKLLSAINRDKLEYINILMYFLKSWNIQNDKYDMKTVGIPQSEFGDQSRLLANFYLQDYDERVYDICSRSNATYIRYADDQIIILKDKSKKNDILYVIANELNKIVLNLNASKVREYNKERIQLLYGIPIFKLLDEKRYDKAAEKFFEYLERTDVDFNYTSSLKKFLNLGLSKFTLHYKNKIRALLTEYQFVRESNEYYMEKIYINIGSDEKIEFLNLLNRISEETDYNGFHYSLIKFMRKNKMDYDSILKRIQEIKKI